MKGRAREGAGRERHLRVGGRSLDRGLARAALTPCAALTLCLAAAVAGYGTTSARAQAAEALRWEPVEAVRSAPGRAVRDVTGRGMVRAVPDLPADAPSRRLPSRASSSPTTAAPEPERFHRVTIEDAGHFRAGTRRVALAGIAALGADATCGGTDARGARPCGRLAAAAVRRLVRTRALDCEPAPPQTPDAARLCHVGPVLLNAWIVRQGWAVPSDDALGETFAELHEAARREGQGLHAAHPAR